MLSIFIISLFYSLSTQFEKNIQKASLALGALQKTALLINTQDSEIMMIKYMQKAIKKRGFKFSFSLASVNKKIFLLLFYSDSNYLPLPLTGLAAAPQSSARKAFATAHLTKRHFSPIVRGATKKEPQKRFLLV